ncbi:alpha-hydroxy acid oxidase [Kutzneria kofuensis]|uniref:L-lactate dehydrogenase (Cytochrome) n=1 Tax=Kutzneria kofuensis TaxID=103725 RepID=A0A7W9KBI2_9PSEU|nr:alpha-hydroxy acid oxidase [Kutzneria kofuensis]MBB5889482.1 L-lactate dehydrogenase (cytochrome) [Kutzneria kofuensis]
MTRRVPRWRELRPLLQPRGLELDPVKRAHTLSDLRAAAGKRVPKAVFDYVEGGADDEISLRRNRSAFDRVEFSPQVLVGGDIDTGTTILGEPAELPLVLAPTGYTRMMHHAGEPAVAQAAAEAGIPYALSTMGTTAPEDLHGDNLWFQLYVWRDRGFTKDMVGRARDAGFRALVLTVDTPVPGNRVRDIRNGLTLPPRLSLSTLLDGATKPRWWWNLLTTEPLRFASFDGDGSLAPSDIGAKMFDRDVTWTDLAWLREVWDGPLVIKGIQSVRDAKKAAEVAADAVVLSNHGGRQLDRGPAPLELVQPVADEVGDRLEVFVDGGIRTGGDIAAAVGLGAKACLIGRPYLYGLMTGGERGVTKVISILREELERTMRLVGANAITDLDRSRVRLRA